LKGIIAVYLPSGKKLTDKVISPEEIASNNNQNVSFKVGPNFSFAVKSKGTIYYLIFITRIEIILLIPIIIKLG